MRFTHIYVEERAYGYNLTGKILEQHPEAVIVPIKHYKDVFDRKRQDIPRQKKSRTLILAVRDGNRIFKGAPVCQSFGHENFYYASSAMNCPFDCEYCYLKGMYPSGYTVVFVNLEDYVKDIEEKLKDGPMYICASFDTDLLGMWSTTMQGPFWIELAKAYKDVLVELRTKWAFAGDAVPNVIYAYTLSPKEVIKKYEHLTADLNSRLTAAANAIDKGANVRLCFDPIIKIPDWENAYKELIEETASRIDLGRLTDVSVGTFRISSDYLNKMRRAYPDSELAWYPYVIKDGYAQYEPDTDRKMQDYVCALLEKHIGREKIFTWN